MKLEWIEGPGILYDLMTMLALRFRNPNRSRFFALMQRDEELQEELECMTEKVQSVSANLALFFTEREDGAIFGMNELFPVLLQSVSSLEQLQNKNLKLNPEMLKQRLFQFYAKHPVSDSLQTTAEAIGQCELPQDLRYHLLSFCMNPESTLNCLFNTLMDLEPCLQQYRQGKEELRKAIERQIYSFSARSFAKRIGNIPGNIIRWDTKKPLRVSLCFFNRYALERFSMDSLAILGTSYEMTLSILRDRPDDLDLMMVLNALGDPLRGRMVKHMLQYKRTLTAGDIGDSLGEMASTIKYQMSVLVKSGLVSMEQNQKKNQLRYRINPDACSFAVRNFSRFLEQGPELTVEEKLHGAAEKWWNQ